jgi:hypothetical protein
MGVCLIPLPTPCPHPASQRTRLATQSAATQFLCNTCGAEFWDAEYQGWAMNGFLVAGGYVIEEEALGIR